MKILLKIVGPLLIVGGGIGVISGFSSFISRGFGGIGPGAMGIGPMGFNPAGPMITFVVSGLVLGAGVVISRFAFLKNIANFVESETHDAVGNVSRNIFKNLVQSPKAATKVALRCRSCSSLNDESARFCSSCGAAI